MAKPTNPNINFPQAFAIDGQKTDFLEEKIQDGFDPIDPDVLAGDNLNKFIDDTYKGLHYAMDGVNDLYKGAVLYSSTETYNSTSIVFSISEDGIALYHSLTDNNLGNPLTDETKWQKVDLGGSSSGTGYQLFDIIAKDHILTEDESLGFALLGTYVNKSVYPDFYNTCVSEKTAGTPTQTQLGDNTITTYNNANGHIFYDIADKAAVDAFYESLGVAWFYGVDTTNERIFLPRGKNYISVTNPESLPVIGNGKQVMYKSPSGNDYGLVVADAASATFRLHGFERLNNAPTLSNGTKMYLTNEASKSGIIAQTQDLFSNNKEAYLYMVVGNTEVEQAIINVTDVTTTENDTLPLFTPKYFDFTPNHVSWLKAGEQANSGGIYTTVYNTLVSELTLPTYGLKVVEVDNMQSNVDYSEYWKVDQDAMTFTTPIRTAERVLVAKKEPTAQDPTWYNWYSDGWLEQGGSIEATSSRLVSLIKPFSTVNYSAFATVEGATQSYTCSVVINSTSEIKVQAGTASSSTKLWQTSGYGAIPQLSDYTEDLKLYFKVANAVQNLQLLDAGEITEALADKIGTTECKAYVTETYSNGASWYRVYSDGWCEQGGQIAKGSNNVTVTFLRAYRDINYTALCSSITSNNGVAANGSVGVKNTNTCTFINDLYSYPMGWECKGYIN